jgi:hypothetical protein
MSDQTTRKENDMRARLTKLIAGLTAVAALAFGGAALAGAASTPSPPALPAASAPADTAQQGDQTAPDKAGASENAPEASTEKADAPEPAESSSESATESASEVPGNDGPGGHADEPGNTNDAPEPPFARAPQVRGPRTPGTGAREGTRPLAAVRRRRGRDLRHLHADACTRAVPRLERRPGRRASGRPRLRRLPGWSDGARRPAARARARTRLGVGLCDLPARVPAACTKAAREAGASETRRSTRTFICRRIVE